MQWMKTQMSIWLLKMLNNSSLLNKMVKYMKNEFVFCTFRLFTSYCCNFIIFHLLQGMDASVMETMMLGFLYPVMVHRYRLNQGMH